MNLNYNNFNYNNDFIPESFVFNVNSNRNIGIGVLEPTKTFEVKGNIGIMGNLIINGNLNYNNNSLNDYISLLKINNDGLIIYNNLVSSNTKGVKWSISNNNNINLTLRDVNDNTDLNYNSNIVNINTNGITNVNISIFNNLTLKYIIIKDSNNNLINNILDNVIIKYNNLTSKIIKNNTGIYELKNYLSLSYNNQYIIEILNLNISGNVQFWGTYDYQAGSMWNQINNGDIYINHNIGIFTNNPSSAIDIKNNGYFNGNINISNNLICDYLTSTLIKTQNITTSHISGNNNNLFINESKKKIIYDSQINHNLINFGNHFGINDDSVSCSNVDANDLNGNDIRIGNENFYMRVNRNESLNLSNIIKNNKNNITFSKNVIIDKNQVSEFLSTSNIPDSSLYVNGDMYINGNLYTKKVKLNNIGVNSEINNFEINCENIKSDFINVDSYCYSENIYSNNIKIRKLFNIPIKKSNNNGLFYNKQENCFMYNQRKLDSYSYELNNYDLNVVGDSKINQLNVENVDVNNIEMNKLKLVNNIDSEVNYNVDSLELQININSNLRTFDFI